MVDHTDFYSSHPKQHIKRVERHFIRWLHHFLYVPWRTKAYFPSESREAIASAVATAEQGHAGEIQVIIEGRLPLHMALYGNTAIRAQQLFAEYGVWDTAFNSGVLLYINLCERQVEILADRGINQYVANNHWQGICQQVTTLLADAQYVEGVLLGIEMLGNTLHQFYAGKEKDLGNELGDGPIIL